VRGEAHLAIITKQFEQMQAAGRFAFHWHAHDLILRYPPIGRR
jgi:ribose 1,5-bisphosphokinase PhnN